MPTRKARPFKVKVHLSLRYVLRFKDDEFEAWCVDAAAVGLGDTQQAALQDLLTNLEVSYEHAAKDNVTILTKADEDEERLFAQLEARQPVEPSVLGYGVVQLTELIPSGADKSARHEPHFEIGQHMSLAA